MSEAIEEARVDLAAAFRWAVRHGLHEGICNHFSFMVPGRDDVFLINAHGYHWSEITASNLVLVDRDGRVVEGTGEVEPTAYYIHWRVHLSAPHARCVLHTHQPYATAMASLKDKRLPIINQNAIRFHDRVAYDEDYGGVVLDTDEGDRLGRKLGNKSVLMMGNHGVMVVGPTVARAFDDLYYLERACLTLLLAMLTRQELDEIDPEVVRTTAAAIAAEQDFAVVHFAALKRVLDRQEPDYRI